MLDFLFAFGQVVCLAAYLYGGYLVIRHGETFRTLEKYMDRRFSSRPDADQNAAWERYLTHNL